MTLNLKQNSILSTDTKKTMFVSVRTNGLTTMTSYSKTRLLEKTKQTVYSTATYMYFTSLDAAVSGL